MKPPVILTPGKLDEINKYVLDRTGCFPFLVPDRRWHYSEPKTGKGAVEIWSVALYAIYHDCGCRYLDFILDSNNEPNSEIDHLLYKSRRHKNDIERILRTNVAHGVFDSYSSRELKRVYFPNETCTIQQISDEQWARTAEKIRRDSDDLVKTIYKWADGYRLCNCNIRTIFGTSDQFKKSIDARIMFNTLDNDFYVRGAKRAKTILEEKSQYEPNNRLKLWRNEISSLYVSKKIDSPADIINKLRSYLFELHNPIQQSSITIGNSFGFSISSLKQ